MQKQTALPILLFVILAFGACKAGSSMERDTVHIVMPALEGMGDPETNYYKQWLEEKSGLAIELEVISSEHMQEYLRLLFSTDYTYVDGIFFGPDSIRAEDIERYGANGAIIPLEGLIAAHGSVITGIFQSYDGYDLKQALTAEDGHIYFMPNLQYSKTQRNLQTLWLNTGWIKNTELPIPQNTEEFREMLMLFYEHSKSQEASRQPTPIGGSSAIDTQFLCHWLMNAFVYTDPQHSYLAVDEGEVYFAPMKEEWRQGLIYCRSLYEDGLLPDFTFTFSEQQLARMANDPRELIGGFTAGSITDVLLKNSPEMLNRYIHIPPIAGPGGVQHSVIRTDIPAVGGVVTSASKSPEAVVRLMDLMLSEQAYLVAAFGEEGVDWKFASPGDISLSGQDATITIKSHEWDLPQNKNFGGYGPFFTYTYYGDGVAWNGYQADQRYLDARAGRLYSEYEPAEYIRLLPVDEKYKDIQASVEAYARNRMLDFITGEQDPGVDHVWAEYLNNFEALGISQFVSAAQEAYGQMDKGNLE